MNTEAWHEVYDHGQTTGVLHYVWIEVDGDKHCIGSGATREAAVQEAQKTLKTWGEIVSQVGRELAK
jgi:hypothetical protein